MSRQKQVSVWRKCPACSGTGRSNRAASHVQTNGLEEEETRLFLMAGQGVCLACKGNGGNYYSVFVCKGNVNA